MHETGFYCLVKATGKTQSQGFSQSILPGNSDFAASAPISCPTMSRACSIGEMLGNLAGPRKGVTEAVHRYGTHMEFGHSIVGNLIRF
ncbi:hypothetical protein TNCV_548671 [Trichonephila clavipes]|nr:hypothetical protein TNCV_548671 [Trichonephila clavipes]